MPRLARQIASSGFYHIMLRGDGKRILFEDDDDRRFFLFLLERYCRKYAINCHAWCLMDNHVHLLLEDTDHLLCKAMHGICLLFAQHYNSKYSHVGGVFQNRFVSLPLEKESHLLRAIRYIHRNPIRACITDDLSYPWSSYNEYVIGASFTCTERILELLGGPEGFRSFCSQSDESTDRRIDKALSGRFTDAEALELADCLLGLDLVGHLESLGKKERDNHLRTLHQAGISIRQIARITGLGRGIVMHACTPTNNTDIE